MNGKEYSVLEGKLNTIDEKIGHVEEMVREQREVVNKTLDEQRDDASKALDRIGSLERGFAGRYTTCPNVRLVNKHEAELNKMAGIRTFLAWVIPLSITIATALVGAVVSIINNGQ